MRYDLAEVLRNPLRFAARQAKHAWDDPRAVPSKTIDYAKYDLVRALNRLVDALGLAESAFERVFSQALAVPASRFLRMKRSVDLLVSDTRTPGRGTVIEGTYQAPIMVQWRRADRGEGSHVTLPVRLRILEVIPEKLGYVCPPCGVRRHSAQRRGGGPSEPTHPSGRREITEQGGLKMAGIARGRPAAL